MKGVSIMSWVNCVISCSFWKGPEFISRGFSIRAECSLGMWTFCKRYIGYNITFKLCKHLVIELVVSFFWYKGDSCCMNEVFLQQLGILYCFFFSTAQLQHIRVEWKWISLVSFTSFFFFFKYLQVVAYRIRDAMGLDPASGGKFQITSYPEGKGKELASSCL